jgi:hypothetical protein
VLRDREGPESWTPSAPSMAACRACSNHGMKQVVSLPSDWVVKRKYAEGVVRESDDNLRSEFHAPPVYINTVSRGYRSRANCIEIQIGPLNSIITFRTTPRRDYKIANSFTSPERLCLHEIRVKYRQTSTKIKFSPESPHHTLLCFASELTVNRERRKRN